MSSPSIKAIKRVSRVLPRIVDKSGNKAINRLYSGVAVRTNGVSDVINAGDVSNGVNIKTIVFDLDADSTTEYIAQFNNSNDGIKLDGTNLVLSGLTGTIYINSIKKNPANIGNYQKVVIVLDIETDFNNVMIGKWTPFFGAIKTCNWQFWTVEPTEKDIVNISSQPEKLFTEFDDNAFIYNNLKDILRSWYPMTEGAGSIIYDGSGNGNHVVKTGGTWLTAQPTPTPQTALIGLSKPIIYNADHTKYIDCGDISVSDWSNVTINCFLLWDGGTEGGWASLYNKGSSLDLGRMLFTPTGKILYQNGNGNFYSDNDGDVPINQLVMVTYEYDQSAGMEYLYVNNVLVGYKTRTGNITKSVDPLLLGKGQNTSYGFSGFETEISIYNIALTTAERAELLSKIDARTHSKSANLVGYWRNDGDTIWTDLSGNGNDGIVNGSPSTILLPEGITAGRDILGFPLTYPRSVGLNIIMIGRMVTNDEIPIQNIFNGGGTYELWVFVRGDGILNDKGSWNVRIIAAAAGKAKVQFNRKFSTTNGQWTTTNADIILNAWNMIQIDYDDSDPANDPAIKINDIVSAVTENLTPVGISVSDIGNDLFTGQDINQLNGANAIIDQPLLYSKILSSSRSTKNYKAGLGTHQ